MLELNHIIKGEDLLSGSVAPQTASIGTSGPHTVFDLKAGGLFKIENTDRAQLKELSEWNSSSH
jgi:hypothetical protein